MNIHKLNLPEPSKLMDDYINSYNQLSSFFEYDYHLNTSYSERLNHLKERTYDRKGLVRYLHGYNKKFQPHQKVMENIERLKREDAVVVVAGQQAGLLTGPIYTVHKCLSILKFAEKQEAELGLPVIPIFWIAGEDHDFDEVNHVHFYENGVIRKSKLGLPDAGLNSVSHLPVDQAKLTQWVKDVFHAYGETQFTEKLLDEMLAFASTSDTIVDFFAALIHHFFSKYGLVLMDSGDSHLRQLESDYFTRMIEQNEAIAKTVTEQLSALKNEGYTVALDQRMTSANMFYHTEGERVLLERSEEGFFVNTSKGISLTRSELESIALQSPEKLSNNVVTRPIMQELLLPTLAFIGGPGEVAYWSALKGAFREMGTLMPPVLPRIRITLLDEKMKKWLKEKGMTIDDALSGQLMKAKKSWLDSQHQWDVEGIYDSVVTSVKDAYQPLRQLARGVNPTLETLTDKNMKYIDEQLAYMKKAIERDLKQKHKVELKKFDRVQAAILPGGSPQERTWSVVYFLNYWGPQLIANLVENNQYSFEGYPLIVEL